MKKLNEDTLIEQPVIEWLKEMGYDYEFGPTNPSSIRLGRNYGARKFGEYYRFR